MSTGALIHQTDLEPSRVSRRTYATRRRLTRVDAVAVLGLLVISIAIIPPRLIVPGMTDIGRPGLIVGLLLFSWWILARLTFHLVLTGPQPMRWAVFAFLTAAIISYAVAFSRPLTSIEKNGADRTMLYFAIIAGIVLMAADGIANWMRLHLLLKVLVGAAVVVALIGILESVLKIDLTRYIVIPGLSAKGDALEFEARGNAIRVASTTTHYIELAAFLAVVQPFAIHFALFSETKKGKRWGFAAALTLAAGIAVTVSRTGIVALVLMLIVLFPVWGWRTRYNMGVVVVGAIAAFGLLSPGLSRTVFRLFDNPGDNSSITARTDRYTLAWHYFTGNPILGRGTGTWIAPQYQIMDNQWIETGLSGGVLGVLTLLGLFITGIVLATKAMRRATTAADRHLCAALISTQVMAIAVAGTFDALAFSTYTAILALTIGLCGTVWRLTHPARAVRTSTTRWFLGRDSWSTIPTSRQSPARPSLVSEPL
jgi:O-antigen ligase